METLNAIRTRRSIREYDQNREVSDEIIMKILEAGHLAPSPKNSQPWLFIVIRNKELIKRIMTNKTPDRPEGDCLLKDSMNPYNINFPKVIIAVFFEKEKSVFFDDRYYGKTDKTNYCNINNFAYSDIIGIGCAIENMALACHDLGLGACITGDLLETGINPEIYSWLDIDKEKYQLVGGIRFGYMTENKKFKTPLYDHIKFVN